MRRLISMGNLRRYNHPTAAAARRFDYVSKKTKERTIRVRDDPNPDPYKRERKFKCSALKSAAINGKPFVEPVMSNE